MRTKYLMISVLASLLFFSCGSSKKLLVDDETTTFVNTTLSEDGGVYTTCVFSEIKFVGKMPLAASGGFSVYDELSRTGGEQIDSSSFEYDSSTGELKLNGGGDKNSAYHVRGVYQNPPVFILHANACDDPLVLFEGKKLVKDVDYTFDLATSKLAFRDEMDIDRASFSIIWLTHKRECAFENDYGKFQAEYDRLHSDWLKKYE